ncbi:MAG: 5-(carboxyamino)imidazole ribonucleotide mutase [Candidatus Hydrogenedentota bacterium]|nr:MAG: 5-(carboxyamino)imidazole ribonucleotide mutase [Candidatus Hydrogenedentota bacterium]
MKVAIIMGSQSDWDPVMKAAADTLADFGVSYEAKVYSAHRTPEALFDYLKTLPEKGVQVIIAGAGMAAHLPGVIAAKTILPVLGVPIPSSPLQGMDSLLSIVQMPGGIPVGTLSIGKAGAKNAAIMAVSILALQDETLEKKLMEYRQKQAEKVLAVSLET